MTAFQRSLELLSMADTQQAVSTGADLAIADEEKRIVTAWVAITHDGDGKPVSDLNDDVLDLDSLEDAINASMAFGGTGMGDEQHERFATSDIVQIFVLSNEEREALGFGKGKAGVIAKFRVNDDATWARVKSGELREASIVGVVSASKVAA